jgi:hypothetical protein
VASTNMTGLQSLEVLESAKFIGHCGNVKKKKRRCC